MSAESEALLAAVARNTTVDGSVMALVGIWKAKFESIAQSATALCAASVIVTSILVPILTAYWSKHMQKKNNRPGVNEGNKATA